MFVHGFLLGWQRLVYSEIIFWHSCVTSLLGKVGQYHHFVKTEAVVVSAVWPPGVWPRLGPGHSGLLSNQYRKLCYVLGVGK